jgi:hypothetical protein
MANGWQPPLLMAQPPTKMQLIPSPRYPEGQLPHVLEPLIKIEIIGAIERVVRYFV